MGWPWSELGIEPTTETREIRRAYNRRIKTIDPEQDPATFQRLREAYEAAFSRARASGSIPDGVAGRGASGARTGVSESAAAAPDDRPGEETGSTDASSASEDERTAVPPTEVEVPDPVDTRDSATGDADPDEGNGADAGDVHEAHASGPSAASIVDRVRTTLRDEGDAAAAELLGRILESGVGRSLLFREQLQEQLLELLEKNREPAWRLLNAAAQEFDWTSVGSRADDYALVADRIDALLRTEACAPWLRRQGKGRFGCRAVAARLLTGNPSTLRLVLATLRPGMLRHVSALINEMENRGQDWQDTVNRRVVVWWQWVAGMRLPGMIHLVAAWIISGVAAAVSVNVLTPEVGLRDREATVLQAVVCLLVPWLTVRLARALALIRHWYGSGGSIASEGTEAVATMKPPIGWLGASGEPFDPESDQPFLAYYFGGRLSRLQFLKQLGAAVLVAFVFFLILAFAHLLFSLPDSVGLSLTATFMGGAFTWVVSAGARRFHDIGLSAAAYLVLLVPVLGPLVLVAWLLLVRGQTEANKHGPPPRPPRRADWGFTSFS